MPGVRRYDREMKFHPEVGTIIEMSAENTEFTEFFKNRNELHICFCRIHYFTCVSFMRSINT